MIYINSMSKAYNSKNVLQNIDLRLEEGRIYGLIGANGSGKSTLIKCICGIYPPDKGEIKMLTEVSNINNDNTIRYDINNSTQSDRKEDSNAYHKKNT